MTEYDPQWVRSFYDAYAEREWERFDGAPTQRVKLRVHLHYLHEFLQDGDRVLDVGAGPGRFTRELARITGRVVVADISPVQLELNRRKAAELGFADAVEEWVECDVCDLSPHFGDAEFDGVVCYGGPLSYVLGERRGALAEMLRVVRPGGRILLSVMSLWGTVHQHLGGVLEIPPDVNREIIATGDLTPARAPASQRCHMFRAAELRAFLEEGGARVDVISASNCLSAAWDGELEAAAQDAETWEHLIELELEACREPGCVDGGTHLIAVCHRPA